MSTPPSTQRFAGHVIDAEIGAARFPVFLGGELVHRVGPLWSARAKGAAVLLVYDGALGEVAGVLGASLSACDQRVVPVAVPPGEPSKDFAQLERLCREAARAGLRRADAVVALGGGVVGDLAGFVAAVYQRGVALVHVPTTLLAMVDSAIGGKTAIDIPEGKNYVGAVWQPQLVVMDTDLLDTLPAPELACGFAEVIKYGLLDSPEFFARVEAWPELPGPKGPLEDLIRACIEHKLRVVEGDEHDLGRRASLNLGHTVGHGIEAAGGYDRYRHGEAVGLGLLAALRVSERRCGLDGQWRERTRAVLERHGLPTRLDDAVATDAILEAMGRDKKADATALNMVLIDEPGSVLLRQDPPRDVVVDAIEELRA